MKKLFTLVVSHALVGVMGFALGVYALPILIAPGAPSSEEVTVGLGEPEFEGQFRRDLEGSDFLHWGEGTVYVGRKAISLLGQLAPGPDYKLYLSPGFVQTEDEFERLKSSMVRVGEVKTFDNFIVAVPEGIDINDYDSVVIWCETFGEFITAARYK